jgi:hypothetical protein
MMNRSRGRNFLVAISSVAVFSASSAVWAAPKVKMGTVSGVAKSGQSGPQNTVATVKVVDKTVAPLSGGTTGYAFVVTDVCFSTSPDHQTFVVQSNPPGSLYLRYESNGNNRCDHFEPGIVVPDADVECSQVNNGVTWDCTVSGIVTKN